MMYRLVRVLVETGYSLAIELSLYMSLVIWRVVLLAIFGLLNVQFGLVCAFGSKPMSRVLGPCLTISFYGPSTTQRYPSRQRHRQITRLLVWIISNRPVLAHVACLKFGCIKHVSATDYNY